jgi:hypothetical protein
MPTPTRHAAIPVLRILGTFGSSTLHAARVVMSLRWGLLALAIVAQLALPLRYIWRGQQALAQGTPYRLATAPVDPYDPFRGRYVALGFRAFPRIAASQPGEVWYLPIAAGADGYAVFGTALRERPASGDYLRLRADALQRGWLRPPFDRYYLDESLAPEAERAYRALSRRRPANGEPEPEPIRAELAIRVLDGYAVPEMLYLDGQPVRDYLAARR